MIRLSELRAWPARLTALGRTAEPRPALSSTALGLDVLLACVAVIASLMIPAAPAVTRFEDHNPWLYGSAAVAVVLPLALRRVYPVAVFWVVLVAIMADNQNANFIS